MKYTLLALILLTITIKVNADAGAAFLVEVNITTDENSIHKGFLKIWNTELEKFGDNELNNLLITWKKYNPDQSIHLYSDFYLWYPHGSSSETGIYLVDSLNYQIINYSKIKKLKYISSKQMSGGGWDYSITVLPTRLIDLAKGKTALCEYTVGEETEGFTFFSLNSKINKAELKRLYDLSPIYGSDEKNFNKNFGKLVKKMVDRNIIPVALLTPC